MHKILISSHCNGPHIIRVGCETWSRTLSEERRLRVLENWVPRRMFEPKRDEVTGEWRKLHNEELNDLYCTPNISPDGNQTKEMGAVHSTYGGEKRCTKGIAEETWGKDTTWKTQP